MQALALSSVLRELGHQCVILYGPVKKPSFFRRFKTGILSLFGKDREKPYRNLRRYVEEHLPVSAPWDGKTIPDCDCFIVGSDQVWRPRYTPLPGAYFLDFLPEGCPAKKIAYSASFGVAKWEFTPVQTEEFGRLLRNFDVVSVREESGVDLCKKYLNCPAQQMPDPVLLHEADFYRKLIPADKKKNSQKTLFVYFLDPDQNKSALAHTFAEKEGLYLVDFLPADKKALRREVEEFICGIDQASFVLTDSFHGMVFSMILGVPFAVTGNAKRGMARFDLAIKAGVPEALLGEEDQLAALQKLYRSPLPGKVREFLEKERLRGRAFLQKHTVRS